MKRKGDHLWEGKALKRVGGQKVKGQEHELSTMMHVCEVSQNIHYFIHQKVIGDI